MPVKSSQKYVTFHYLDGTHDEYDVRQLLSYNFDRNVLAPKRPQSDEALIAMALHENKPILVGERKTRSRGNHAYPIEIRHIINSGLVKKVEFTLK